MLQDMQRVVTDRLPVVATCAEELTTMQCAALSCFGALLTSYTSLPPPANNVTHDGIQGANAAEGVGFPVCCLARQSILTIS